MSDNTDTVVADATSDGQVTTPSWVDPLSAHFYSVFVGYVLINAIFLTNVPAVITAIIFIGNLLTLVVAAGVAGMRLAFAWGSTHTFKPDLYLVLVGALTVRILSDAFWLLN